MRPIFQIRPGLPPNEFYPKAWASEPLTKVLPETNISVALPFPDEVVSLVAMNSDQTVVGQCSANDVVKYWDHVEKFDAGQETISTQVFAQIHRKAATVEKQYLSAIQESLEASLHNAGIAVLPEYRGNGLGRQMVEHQVRVCKDGEKTTLFCETTNRYSAALMEPNGFTKVAEFPYDSLATELGRKPLSNLKDVFTVWCLKV